MPHSSLAPVTGAVVIPFPRFSRPRTRRAPACALGSSPDFDAGFNAGIDFAFNLVRQIKAHGRLSHAQGV